MIFNDCADLSFWWREYISERLSDLLTNRFKKEFEMLKERGITTSIYYDDRIDSLLTELNDHDITELRTFEGIRHLITNFQIKNRTSAMMAGVVMNTNNGVLVIKELYVKLNMDTINTYILSNIGNQEKLKEIFDTIIAHEMGHFIDYMKYIDMPVSVYYDSLRHTKPYYEEFYEWTAQHKGPEYAEESLRKYYSIPDEDAANKIGGVDTEKLIALELSRNENVHKNVKIEIKVLETKEKTSK